MTGVPAPFVSRLIKHLEWTIPIPEDPQLHPVGRVARIPRPLFLTAEGLCYQWNLAIIPGNTPLHFGKFAVLHFPRGAAITR